MAEPPPPSSEVHAAAAAAASADSMSKSELGPHDDERPRKPNRCDFFLARKRRYCTVPRLPTSKYCGNHVGLEEGYQDKAMTTSTQVKRGSHERVPCPLDPLHTVYRRELKRHLRVCNIAKEKEDLAHQAFYKPGINSGATSSLEMVENDKPIMGADDAHSFFAKMEKLANEKGAHVGGHNVEQLTNGPVAARILASMQTNGWTSEGKARHLTQQASLVSHLDRRGLLQDKSICIEMGAGRGTLGQAVHLAFPTARVILVERSGVKHKADSVFRRTGEGSYFERYKLDIRDLWVHGLPFPPVQPGDPPLVFLGKHVCGVATDLSLRAIAVYVREGGARPVGVCIATCCYHVCKYDDYVGKETWEKELGLTPADFQVAHRCACWVSSLLGTRGHRYKPRVRKEDDRNGGGEEEEEEEEEDAGEREAPETDEPHQKQNGEDTDHGDNDDFISYGKGLSHETKIAYGRVCKRLIDYGRLQFLRSCGLETECALYCEPENSPENSCILAWSPSSSLPSA